MTPLGEAGIAPEVVATWRAPDGRLYVLTANEVCGDVSVLEVR